MIGMTNASGGSGELNTSSMPIAFIFSTSANTSSTPQVGTTQGQSYNSEYVSYSSGEFTFKKACTCTVYGRGTGTRDSSGTLVTLMWNIYKNGRNGTALAGKNGSGSTSDSATATFAVGDRVGIYGRCSSGDRCGMTMAVKLPE